MRNTLKGKIAAGQVAYGVSVMIPSPQAVEMVAGLGFDFVLIDCEHGTIGVESIEVMVMAAECGGVTPIVRPPSNAPEDISRAMDRGAHGVQVPHVRSAAEARRSLEAVKFAPLGTRSLAVGTRPGRYGYGLSRSAFVAETNRESLVCVQLEDVEAIERLDEILTVGGVDVFFVGPSDLSQSMGYASQPEAPAVAEAIADALARIRRAGRASGSAGSLEALLDYRRQGALYLYTHLTRLLSDGAAAFFAGVKEADRA